jgi:predicted nuclease of restriction endonuclease-like (RecB) superfamily
MSGFSSRNVKYMRAFAEVWTDEQIVQQVVAQLPWGHNIELLSAKLKSIEERLWYARANIQNGWSRSVLAMQIDTLLHKRQGAVISNFSRTLPAPQSELVRQTFKDPYIFDFLTIAHDAIERDVEIGLIEHISNFMLELGRGFAYMGRQFPLKIGDQSFVLDLLFYNVNLNCFVVIDLKMDEFRPEYAGKMQFYLNILEDTHKSPIGALPVGMILCRSKNNVVVEYALRDSNRAIGVSEYSVTQSPPPQLQSILPSAEEMGREIEAAEASLEDREAEKKRYFINR